MTHSDMVNTRTITTDSPAGTLELGSRLARELAPGDLVALIGELGAGKTMFTKGIAKGLGVGEYDYVNSPSFVVIKEYPGEKPLYHFDIYRLEEKSFCETLDYEEYFYGEGVSVIEWADRLGKLMPSDYVKVHIAIQSENTRSIIISASGKRSRAVVEHIHENYCH